MSFKSAVKKFETKTTKTEKGAITLSAVDDPLVAFFYRTVRGIDSTRLIKLFKDPFIFNPIGALRLLMYTRDTRGGKGERDIFKTCYQWLITQFGKSDMLIMLTKNMVQFGRWEDLLNFCFETNMEDLACEIFATQLKKDKVDMEANELCSLAGKWAPTEKCAHDRKHHSCLKIARLLYPDNPKTRLKRYRKEYLVPLRAHIRVIEPQLCANKWGEIEYSKVPSCAMNKYRHAFENHDLIRFEKYIENVRKGETDIKASQIYPYQLVHTYLSKFMRRYGSRPIEQVDDVIEVQWDQLVKDLKASGTLKNALAMADVSGSMFGSEPISPIYNSIALSILFAQTSQGGFENLILTFSERPEFIDCSADTLRGRITKTRSANWGMTTNIQNAFELILNVAITQKVSQDNMVKHLFIFSDMQFDEANRKYSTNFEELKRKFNEAGYDLPIVIFWNLASRTIDFPTKSDQENVFLVSGFSPAIMKAIIETGTPNPVHLIQQIIDDPKYSCITLDEDIDLTPLTDDEWADPVDEWEPMHSDNEIW